MLLKIYGYSTSNEVFAHDWLLVLIRYKDDKEIIFHNSLANNVQQFIDMYDPILIGHNARYYDQYILKAVLSSYTPEEIKDVNDYIINGGQGFELDFGYVEIPPIWDTIQDIVPMRSLKEIEANLRLNITETTIPFDLPTKWTKKEYEEVLYYCEHDVMALKPLFEKRYGYFKTKFDICLLSNIDPLYNTGLTNAKLCAKFLKAKMIKRDDEREYTIPSNISIDLIDKKILNFFARIKDNSISDDELFTSKLDYDFHGMPSVFAWGGAHGAKANFIYDYTAEPNKIVINEDFASLYPHLLALPTYNFISRNIQDKNAYYNTLKHRLQLKKEGKKEEQLPLKLILNTTYGCQNNKYNDLYDPRGARGTCISGQLLISELTERIYSIGDVELVQLNTDGLMVKLPKNKLEEYYKVSNEFSKKCGIELEYDIIYKIVQRDVNNYCMIYGNEESKKIKAKGGCFSALPEIKINKDGTLDTKVITDFKSNSLSIVAESILKKLLFNIPVEETINNCNDIFRFQIISHLGTTYEKCVQESPNGDIELQRNNRIYAGKIPSGAIIKVKPNGRRDSLASQPPNPIIDNGNKCTIEDINKEWYIEIANQRVNDFLGIKRLEEYKKDELITLAEELGLDIDKKTKKADLIKIIKEKKKGNEMTMATKQELEEKLQKSLEQNEKLVEKLKERNDNVEAEKQIIKPLDDKQADTFSLLHKIHQFRKKVRERNFEFDKELPANLGGGEYYSIDQFYNAVQEIALEVGLDFSFETTRLLQFDKELTKPANKLPIHVATVETVAKFTDINTGKGKQYITIAQGSDTIDKAVASASSMAFRNWFYKNFTPKNMSEEELDEKPVEESKPKVPVYVPEKKKEEIKKEVVKQVQQETSDDEDIKAICENIMKIKKLSGDETYGVDISKELTSGILSSADILERDLKIKKELKEIENKIKENSEMICENIMKIRDYPGCEKYGDKTLPKLMDGNITLKDISEIDLKVKQKLKKVQNG